MDVLLVSDFRIEYASIKPHPSRDTAMRHNPSNFKIKSEIWCVRLLPITQNTNDLNCVTHTTIFGKKGFCVCSVGCIACTCSLVAFLTVVFNLRSSSPLLRLLNCRGGNAQELLQLCLELKVVSSPPFAEVAPPYSGSHCSPAFYMLYSVTTLS